MTKYEEIKAMDAKELAKFLVSMRDCRTCPASETFCDGKCSCSDAILKWLTEGGDAYTRTIGPDEIGKFQHPANPSYAHHVLLDAISRPADAVHHPSHYSWRGGMEASDIAREMCKGSEGIAAYLIGCAVKYLYRYPKKNGLQDLDKAIECLTMLREYRYGKEDNENE